MPKTRKHSADQETSSVPIFQRQIERWSLLVRTVETVFLMPHEKYTYISSRLIKEVASFGTSVAGMVPPIVEKRLAEKYPPK